MRILITGSNGILGSALIKQLGARHEVMGLGRGVNRHMGVPYFTCDITDKDALADALTQSRPDWMVHAAAMTQVDRCEKDPPAAFKINAEGAGHAADLAALLKIKALLISTDYVFDGRKRAPYTEEDPPQPINVYGKSKRSAEERWLRALKSGIVFRTSWLFGSGGNNFILKIAEGLRRDGQVGVVTDEWGSPTCARDAARAIDHLLATVQTRGPDKFLTIHYCNQGAVSRYEWARFVARCLGYPAGAVYPIRADESGRAARRPSYSVLDPGAWRKKFKDEPRDIWSATSAYLEEEVKDGSLQASFKAHQG